VLSKINLAVVGTLMVLPHLAVAADNTAARPVEIAVPALPTVSIESMCSAAQWAGLGESSSSEYGSCIRDERSAFEQLRQRWEKYPTEARVTCIIPGVEIDYVGLLTCLQMRPGGSLWFDGSDSASQQPAQNQPSL
jgi:hypothetical protein